jgi:hypothetical protein
MLNDDDSMVVTFSLPNTPDVQGEMVAALGFTGQVGDELFELVCLRPDYPDGFAGPTVRVEATFMRVGSASFLVSFDRLFRGAFSPWPDPPSVSHGG